MSTTAMVKCGQTVEWRCNGRVLVDSVSGNLPSNQTPAISKSGGVKYSASHTVGSFTSKRVVCTKLNIKHRVSIQTELAVLLKFIKTEAFVELSTPRQLRS